jgi:hypothetical protein
VDKSTMERVEAHKVNPVFAVAFKAHGNPGEACCRYCPTHGWVSDGMAVVVTPAGKASDDAQFPTCPRCGQKIERITT